MIGGQGGFSGADLSGYGMKRSAASVREAIVYPDKNFDRRRAAVVVITRSGKTYSGIVRNEDNFSLQMQTADGNFHLFDKAELARIERQTHSTMPSNYAAKLTRGELDDLVSFLANAPGAQETRAEDEEQ